MPKWSKDKSIERIKKINTLEAKPVPLDTFKEADIRVKVNNRKF